MSNITLSTGETIARSTFDRRIENAKYEKRELFLEVNGYFFCERCRKNEHGCPGIAVSHLVSVADAIGRGEAEIAYDPIDMELAGQKCHREYENNFTNDERYEEYIDKKNRF